MKNNTLLVLICLVFILAQCTENKLDQADSALLVWDGVSKTVPDSVNQETQTIYIRKASELAWIAEKTNADSTYNGFQGYTVKQIANLDLGGVRMGAEWSSEGKLWTPIGTSRNNRSFKGNYDGAGFQIQNLYIDDNTDKETGLFGLVEGTISNVTLASAGVHISKMGSTRYVGGICGKSQGSINSCINHATLLAGDSMVYAGGICAYSTGEISNCINYGRIYDEVQQGSADTSINILVGGICAYTESDINRCQNYGILSSAASKTAVVGGICGKTTGSLSQCTNHANVMYASYFNPNNVSIGGITVSAKKINFCTNSGNLSGYRKGTLLHISGIACIVDSIDHCENNGTISVTSAPNTQDLVYLSGIAMNSNAILSCVNNGNISSFGPGAVAYIGGICSNTGRLLMKCRNYGNFFITDDLAYIGGISMQLNNSTVIECLNAGNVSSDPDMTLAGGIAATTNKATIVCSVNWGRFPGLRTAGIVANALNTTIAACYSINQTYGICSSMNGVQISNCYFSGDKAHRYEGNLIGKLSATAWPDSNVPGWGSTPPANWDEAKFGSWSSPWVTLGYWRDQTPVYPQLRGIN